MHHVGIVVACEDVTRAAHVGGQLIHLVKPAIDHRAHERLIPQVTNSEIVCVSLMKLGKLHIDTAYPKPFLLETRYQMATNKSASATYQC